MKMLHCKWALDQILADHDTKILLNEPSGGGGLKSFEVLKLYLKLRSSIQLLGTTIGETRGAIPSPPMTIRSLGVF